MWIAWSRWMQFAALIAAQIAAGSLFDRGPFLRASSEAHRMKTNQNEYGPRVSHCHTPGVKSLLFPDGGPGGRGARVTSS